VSGPGRAAAAAPAGEGAGAGGARDPAASEAREAFYRAVQKAIDDEAAAPPNGAAR
jgi:hypothetical protein